jgi:hypothetical protein
MPVTDRHHQVIGLLHGGLNAALVRLLLRLLVVGMADVWCGIGAFRRRTWPAQLLRCMSPT